LELLDRGGGGGGGGDDIKANDHPWLKRDQTDLDFRMVSWDLG